MRLHNTLEMLVSWWDARNKIDKNKITLSIVPFTSLTIKQSTLIAIM